MLPYQISIKIDLCSHCEVERKFKSLYAMLKIDVTLGLPTN